MPSYDISWPDLRQLAMIASLKSARLTGSFARGDYREDSDLDFRLNERDLARYKTFLLERDIPFDSELPGHITANGIEVFTGFNRQKSTHAAVIINGLQFKTG